LEKKIENRSQSIDQKLRDQYTTAGKEGRRNAYEGGEGGSILGGAKKRKRMVTSSSKKGEENNISKRVLSGQPGVQGVASIRKGRGRTLPPLKKGTRVVFRKNPPNVQKPAKGRRLPLKSTAG